MIEQLIILTIYFVSIVHTVILRQDFLKSWVDNIIGGITLGLLLAGAWNYLNGVIEVMK